MKQFDHVVRAIVERCGTEEEVHELLSGLASVNWLEAIATREYERSLRMCSICRGMYEPNSLTPVVDSYGKVDMCELCTECVSNYKHMWTCICCGKEYPCYRSQYGDFVCKECPNIKGMAQKHNSRAEKLGLPATLTIRQWAKTVWHFNRQCAYCQGKHEVLEHYMPIELGGGTTIDNCLPACQSCNSKKSRTHPSQLDGMFPVSNLSRIREYLAALKRADNPYGVELAAQFGIK